MKKATPFSIIAIILLLSLVFSGCQSMGGTISGDATPVAEDVQEPPASITVDETGTTAEGRLVPRETVDLAFTTAGQVDEVLVKKGDAVTKGQVLARLTGRPQLESVIAAAQYELFQSEQALQTLEDNLDIDQNQALQTLNIARQAVYDAERKVSSLGGSADQTDIDLAYTQLLFAQEELDRAKDRFQPYANKPETNLVRARLQVDLANAQKAYDDALRKYNALTGSASNFDLNQAQTDLEIAQGQLTLAQEKFDLLQKGPDPDLVENAQARITAAQARLKAADADLDKLDLVATMDGTVVMQNLVPGQTVSPGQAVIELADFSEWYVETEDLTEIEVVDIQVGQLATIVPDALPDVEMDGEVVEISDTFQELRGDIVYTVRLKLGEVDPRLRWGMTVVVNFK